MGRQRTDLGYNWPAQNAEDEAVIRKMRDELIPRAEVPRAVMQQTASCAIVSTAGWLIGRGQGAEIDKHDLVIRQNWGGVTLPVVNPGDFGSRTNVLLFAHKDHADCYIGDDCNPELCVPHVLHSRGRRPLERLQFMLVELEQAHWIRKFLKCRKKLGANAWRLQLLHPDFTSRLPPNAVRPRYGLQVGNNKISSGFMSFLASLGMCGSVKLYGFAGTQFAGPYHGYRACDTDYVLKGTKKCPEGAPYKNGKNQVGALTAQNATLANGSKMRVNVYHPFDAEVERMRAVSQLSRKCWRSCDCTVKLPKPSKPARPRRLLRDLR